MFLVAIQCLCIRQFSNSFLVRWVLEDVGIVVILTVQLCTQIAERYIARNSGA